MVKMIDLLLCIIRDTMEIKIKVGDDIFLLERYMLDIIPPLATLDRAAMLNYYYDHREALYHVEFTSDGVGLKTEQSTHSLASPNIATEELKNITSDSPNIATDEIKTTTSDSPNIATDKIKTTTATNNQTKPTGPFTIQVHHLEDAKLAMYHFRYPLLPFAVDDNFKYYGLDALEKHLDTMASYNVKKARMYIRCNWENVLHDKDSRLYLDYIEQENKRKEAQWIANGVPRQQWSYFRGSYGDEINRLKSEGLKLGPGTITPIDYLPNALRDAQGENMAVLNLINQNEPLVELEKAPGCCLWSGHFIRECSVDYLKFIAKTVPFDSPFWQCPLNVPSEEKKEKSTIKPKSVLPPKNIYPQFNDPISFWIDTFEMMAQYGTVEHLEFIRKLWIKHAPYNSMMTFTGASDKLSSSTRHLKYDSAFYHAVRTGRVNNVVYLLRFHKEILDPQAKLYDYNYQQRMLEITDSADMIYYLTDELGLRIERNALMYRLHMSFYDEFEPALKQYLKYGGKPFELTEKEIEKSLSTTDRMHKLKLLVEFGFSVNNYEKLVKKEAANELDEPTMRRVCSNTW